MIDFTVNLICFFILGWIETLWNFEKFLILRYFYKSFEIQIERRMILIRLIIRLIINLLIWKFSTEKEKINTFYLFQEIDLQISNLFLNPGGG